MKDAYSFHESKEDLEKYYYRVFDAYYRIFKRIGLKRFIDIKSDSGMMGGSVAHEFMLLTEVGEDSIVLCNDCDYRANMEVAECKLETPKADAQPLTLVDTGEDKTIDEVCSRLNIAKEYFVQSGRICSKGQQRRSRYSVYKRRSRSQRGKTQKSVG